MTIVYHVTELLLNLCKKPFHSRTQSPYFESGILYFESGFSKVKSGSQSGFSQRGFQKSSPVRVSSLSTYAASMGMIK